MNSIIKVTGTVTYPITIDPSVWIFDDRKKSAALVFSDEIATDINEHYTKETSKHWDREITEGVQVNTSQAPIYKKTALVTGTFFMPLAPFIRNAEPHASAQTLIICTEEKNYPVSISELENVYLLFCKEGKPLTEDGPIHVYLKNKGKDQQPITYVKELIIQ